MDTYVVRCPVTITVDLTVLAMSEEDAIDGCLGTDRGRIVLRNSVLRYLHNTPANEVAECARRGDMTVSVR